jgi:LPS sulfotransferase NodH
MIVPVQGIRWEILTTYPSKVIFMTRDVEEIRQSQEAYYAREGSVDIAYLRSALATQKVRLKNHDIDFMEVNYNELLKDKVRIISDIKEFIKSDKDITKAVDFVQPKQNRFKKGELVSGL